MLIDGQPVMDVDYQAMYYSLLMYVDGSDCGPVGDPFHIPGYESYRGTFKKIAYALLNSPTSLNNAPNNLMPKNSKISYKELRSILLMKLPLLKKYLKSEIGMGLMNLESKIIGEAIDYMMTFKYGFVVMHDGLLVAQNAESAQQCLEQAFLEITGWMPVVTTTNH
jgi:hypothetical protein